MSNIYFYLLYGISPIVLPTSTFVSHCVRHFVTQFHIFYSVFFVDVVAPPPSSYSHDRNVSVDDMRKGPSSIFFGNRRRQRCDTAWKHRRCHTKPFTIRLSLRAKEYITIPFVRVLNGRRQLAKEILHLHPT